ncbi:hypothetical protein P3T73_08165 [Kiritimatiellota bacterium B12222]|nr:hypothetical protein P3T73_08165 [Kiritimatiellota bacterium B12222]
MQISLLYSTFRDRYPAHPLRGLQLFSLLFLCTVGCVSTPPPDLNVLMPEGYYKFDCPIVYKNGLVQLTHEQGKAKVQLLGDFTGSFYLTLDKNRNIKFSNSEMSYQDLNRSFKGEGTLLEPGVASGEAVAWIKTVGPISRNHREGLWTLNLATPQEIDSFLRKQDAYNKRLQRAIEAGLEVD